MTAPGGQSLIMRRLLPALAAALLTVATVAFADDPPSTPLTLSAPAAGSDLPDMGSPAAAVLSRSDEYRLGAMVTKELRDQNALIEDPEISEYVNGVGTRLAAQSAEGGRGFQYFVIKEPSINAFAVPGGFVFINAGLVLASSTESELAGVMAHETAHVTQHHIARMINDQSKQSLTTAAALLGAILLGAARGGRCFLAGSGFDPYGMGQMFETMSRHEGLAATYIPAMLIDHPVTTDRIAEQRARAAQFPPRKGKDSQGYELIRERVRVLTATGEVDLAQAYAQKLAHGHATLGNRYGEALALMNGNRADEATRILAPLVQQHEALTLLHVALGQAQAKAGHL